MIFLATNSLIDFTLSDALDIVFVALLIYIIYKLIKGTVAIRIFVGIFAIYLLWKMVEIFEMRMFTEILGQFISVGVIALIIVFQQETRKFLLMLGSGAFLRNNKLFRAIRMKTGNQINLDYKKIVDVSREFSANKTGALFVIVRQNSMDDIVRTGVELNADLSIDLLESIFFKNNPLHDGAVIINNNKIIAARCILPITKRISIPARYGLRHRAAIGIAESTDAIVIVVSEETGNISLIEHDNIRYNISASELTNFFISQQS